MRQKEKKFSTYNCVDNYSIYQKKKYKELEIKTYVNILFKKNLKKKK